jgi:uncharacterized coiled-coil protein SlyX
MEESSLNATDAADGTKFLWILGAFALVLGIVSVIIGLRANNNIEKINDTLATTLPSDQGKKVSALEEKFESLNSTLAAQRKEIDELRAALNSTARGVSDLKLKTNSHTDRINGLTAIVGVRTTPGTGGVQPPLPPRPPLPGGITPGTPNRPGPQGGVHTVRAGDNFSRIAGQYGVTVSAIEVANPGVDSRKLGIGQQIKIPPRDTVVTPRPQPPNRTVTPPPPPARRPNTTPAPQPPRPRPPADARVAPVPAP